MKKFFKLMTFILIFVLSIGLVDAATYNYSCHYSLTDGKGDVIKFGIRFKDMEADYYKNSTYNGNDSNFWKKHVSYLYYKNGKLTEKSFNFWSGGTISDFDGSDRKYLKEIVLPSQTSAYTYMKKSVNLEKNTIECPGLYWNNYDEGTQTLTSNRAVVSLSPTSIVTVDAYLGETKQINNNVTTFLGSYCYDSSTATSGKACTSITGTTGLYDRENNVECEYTSNLENYKFKLVYDKNNKTLRFDDEGHGWTLDSSVPTTTKDGKIYITDSSMLTKFENAAKSNACPSQLDCDCSNNVVTGKGRVCYFNNSEHENGKCGKVASQNGTPSDPSNPSGNPGDTPGAPTIDITGGHMDCSQLAGKNIVSLIKLGITTLRIAGAIIAIVVGMMNFIPAITSKDADGLKKASRKSVYMLIILVLIFLLPTIIRVIGNLFDFDTTCFL